MTEQLFLAHMQDNVSSSPILNSPQNPPLIVQEDEATTNERYTFSVVTSSRYESLVEENHTITESSPTGTQAIISQPSNQPTTTSSSTPAEHALSGIFFLTNQRFFCPASLRKNGGLLVVYNQPL